MVCVLTPSQFMVLNLFQPLATLVVEWLFSWIVTMKWFAAIADIEGLTSFLYWGICLPSSPLPARCYSVWWRIFLCIDRKGSDREAQNFSGSTDPLLSYSFLHDTSIVGWSWSWCRGVLIAVDFKSGFIEVICLVGMDREQHISNPTPMNPLLYWLLWVKFGWELVCGFSFLM